MSAVTRVCRSMIEYETPKVVTIHNPTIGLIRRCLQLCVVMYVCLYQLWYAQVARRVVVVQCYQYYCRGIRSLQGWNHL